MKFIQNQPDFQSHAAIIPLLAETPVSSQEITQIQIESTSK